MECWLLWDVCYFHDLYNGCDWNDVWTDPLTFDQRRAGTTWPDWGNGDGTLFYPGTPRGIAGPVSSVRMKNWRRGAQDYEYMWLLDQRGRGSLVDEVVEGMVPYAFGDAEGRDHEPGATTRRNGRRRASSWVKRWPVTWTTPTATTSPRDTRARASGSTSAWATRGPRTPAYTSNTSSPTVPAPRGTWWCRRRPAPPWTSTPAWGRGGKSRRWSTRTRPSGWSVPCTSPTGRGGRAATTCGGRRPLHGNGTSPRVTRVKGSTSGSACSTRGTPRPR